MVSGMVLATQSANMYGKASEMAWALVSEAALEKTSALAFLNAWWLNMCPRSLAIRMMRGYQ